MKFSFFCSNLNEKLNSYWADNIDDTNQIQIDKRLGALSCWNIHESVWWKDNINRSLLINLMALPSIPCTLCFISCAQFFPYAADLNQMKIHISWKKNWTNFGFSGNFRVHFFHDLYINSETNGKKLIYYAFRIIFHFEFFMLTDISNNNHNVLLESDFRTGVVRMSLKCQFLMDNGLLFHS